MTAPTPFGAVYIADASGAVLDITAPTVVKAAPGRLVRLSVIVAGSASGTINDVAATSGAATSNQIGTIPTTVGTTLFDWPCATGIVVVPGTGQTVAVTYL